MLFSFILWPLVELGGHRNQVGGEWWSKVREKGMEELDSDGGGQLIPSSSLRGCTWFLRLKCK